MNSFISILSFQTSSCSGENLAGGLLAVSEGKIWLKTSDLKLEIAQRLCGKPYKIELEQIIQLIQNHIEHPTETTPQVFSAEYFSYLNRYSKGALQFSVPKPVGTFIDEATFDMLYKQFIGEPPLVAA
ncbi:MAG: hypothetical protein EAZ14_01680 [Runella slithyformis]|jgi:hypothetical protein|nr:MAG: hypothetical protein EAZ32_13355 [Cytophagia bacterium]TAH15598.1 MAG: hypothetical protein EAZ14_01680 [Runella slithyformis]